MGFTLIPRRTGITTHSPYAYIEPVLDRDTVCHLYCAEDYISYAGRSFIIASMSCFVTAPITYTAYYASDIYSLVTHDNLRMKAVRELDLEI